MDVSRETSEDDEQEIDTAAQGILRLAPSVGVNPTPEQARCLARHTVAVLRAASNVNLTGIRNLEDAVRLHVIDSLSVLGVVKAPIGPAVDIGSGAGFPGIPLAVVGGIPVTLLEPRQKRARFLAQPVEELGLGDLVSVSARRAEEEATAVPGAYQFAVARAVADLPALVELASPLLGLGGEFAALKGSLGPEEQARGLSAARRVGLEEQSVARLELPENGERRAIVVYRKIREPSVRLPRRPGFAQKRPLA